MAPTSNNNPNPQLIEPTQNILKLGNPCAPLILTRCASWEEDNLSATSIITQRQRLDRALKRPSKPTSAGPSWSTLSPKCCRLSSEPIHLGILGSWIPNISSSLRLMGLGFHGSITKFMDSSLVPAVGPICFSYNPSFSACFFSRNSVSACFFSEANGAILDTEFSFLLKYTLLPPSIP